MLPFKPLVAWHKGYHSAQGEGRRLSSMQGGQVRVWMRDTWWDFWAQHVPGASKQSHPCHTEMTPVCNHKTFCGEFQPVSPKHLGLIRRGPLSIASSMLPCMTALSSSTFMHRFHPYFTHLALSLSFFCGFWGQGFLRGSVPFSTSRKASLMEIFQFSILDCSKLSQVRGLGRILLLFI